MPVEDALLPRIRVSDGGDSMVNRTSRIISNNERCAEDGALE